MKMAKGNIIFVSTKEKELSAIGVRMKYFKKALEANGYTVTNFKINLKGLRKYLNYFFRSTPKDLVEASKNADLVMTTTPTLLNAILSHKVARKNGLPLIVDVRDVWEEYAKIAHPLMYYLGPIKKIVAEYYEALRYASKISVVTEPIKKYYEKILGEEKVVVITNGTDVDVIKCEGKKSDRDIDLVYLADLDHPYHNVEFLLDALKYNSLKLILIGGGKYLTTMKEYAQSLEITDRVSFAGWASYENLAAYLCRVKVGVVGRPFTSNIGYLYAIPVKTYDYLAAGLPVAGYGPKGSALEEFINKNAIGVYISQPDPKALSNRLVELVAKHEKYMENARSLAMQFDRKKLAQKMVKIVNDVLSN
ncbi:MAG: glycosyltransferase [Candidatus Bathyarchaeota archaeon]|jgi:glycosyltransferase involved in cell wall biosynthesis|nr:glycosyltransferase [Candidatus Bathyarchaeota archaeon A05DMB-3]MDH7607312.1 glycosyltransferase [Candidatus Bathyarchaeota archaeon]